MLNQFLTKVIFEYFSPLHVLYSSPFLLLSQNITASTCILLPISELSAFVFHAEGLSQLLQNSSSWWRQHRTCSLEVGSFLDCYIQSAFVSSKKCVFSENIVAVCRFIFGSVVWLLLWEICKTANPMFLWSVYIGETHLLCSHCSARCVHLFSS